VLAIACSCTPDRDEPIIATAAIQRAELGPTGCAVGVPAAACVQPGLRVCHDGDRDRVGEWRYAVITSPFDPTQDLGADVLDALWQDGGLAASAETQAALSQVLGASANVAPLAGRPQLDPTHRAIVPAHELTPHWTVLTIDNQHPLGDAPDQLVVPLCGSPRPAVRNIDPARVTTLVMSGTTALTRRIADRMDKRGTSYPAREVKPWFVAADLVHVSNEVSFVRRCDPSTGKTERTFCSREEYIELLEAIDADIVELTGTHLHDYGRKWIDHTIDMYEERGWAWFGGGRTQIEATEPRIVEHAGNYLAFLGCNAVGTRLHSLTAGAGIAGCDWARMEWQIADLRRRGFVPIVSIQHDEVYTHRPPFVLARDLRRMAAAGAAFVMGSQAHCAHPWEMHYGTFVHYGGGNILFDLSMEPLRDATTDKLYIHAGKLLTVELLYTRLEEFGRPRLLSTRERAGFLKELTTALKSIRGGKPWAQPVLPALTRTRPDSFVMKGINQTLGVTVPAKLDDKKRYPLVIDLDGSAGDRPDAFVITRTGSTKPSAKSITEFIVKKYPVDAAKVTVLGAATAKVDEQPEKPKRGRTKK
jgi:poly-gamma-glutamate synthesis protein (capsule biosynthesis protein)